MRTDAVLVVNGRSFTVGPEPDRPLLGMLRDELGLTGAKIACAEGVCGACTVMIDGEAVRACVTPLSSAIGRTVTTIEGLAPPDGLHPLQIAFVTEGAFQCGYCTPGMIMAAAVALDGRSTPPMDVEVKAALERNICRCGAYARIVAAVLRAAADVATEPASVGRRLEVVASPLAEPWDLSGDHGALFAWLGDGLLIVSSAGVAWLHVAADGSVTVASGKVDVGQGSAAELARVVAANLHVDPAMVKVVVGDTDLAPYDAGTFGSRTTPDVVPAVAGAASAAREVLERLAAAEWGTKAASLTTANGRVASRGHEAGFGELVRGLRRIEAASPGRVEATTVAGPVIDATDVVTGRRRFTSDLALPGMLHGRAVRPPAPGSELIDIDTTDAERFDGVRVVRDGDLVGVVAGDPRMAAQGLDAVRSTWSQSSGPSSAELDAHLRSHPAEVEGWGGGTDESRGDVEAGLRSAAVRLEATYRTAFIAHDPLETRAAVAHWEADGRLTVWTGTQRPFGVRQALAEALGMGEASIRVVVPPTGSAYGGKHTGETALEAARLARAVGAPVKVRWTREEEMAWGYVRPAAVIDVRSGVDADGRLVAWDIVNVNSGPRALEPPYRVPNLRARYQPAASPLRQGSYRALSATANTFARESHIDELGRAIGADPLDFRLGQLDDERLADVLRAAAERAGWPGDARVAGRGMGLACSVEKGGRVATVAEVEAAPGGPLRLERVVVAFECGAIIDPDNLRNQVAGATVMGLGGALFEALELEDGRVTNVRQSSYRVPRFSDVPPIEVVLVDRPDLPSEGAGETPLIAVAPAIANAIDAACGVRIRDLPLVPNGTIPGP